MEDKIKLSSESIIQIKKKDLKNIIKENNRLTAHINAKNKLCDDIKKMFNCDEFSNVATEIATCTNSKKSNMYNIFNNIEKNEEATISLPKKITDSNPVKSEFEKSQEEKKSSCDNRKMTNKNGDSSSSHYVYSAKELELPIRKNKKKNYDNIKLNIKPDFSGQINDNSEKSKNISDKIENIILHPATQILIENRNLDINEEKGSPENFETGLKIFSKKSELSQKENNINKKYDETNGTIDTIDQEKKTQKAIFHKLEKLSREPKNKENMKKIEMLVNAI